MFVFVKARASYAMKIGSFGGRTAACVCHVFIEGEAGSVDNDIFMNISRGQIHGPRGAIEASYTVYTYFSAATCRGGSSKTFLILTTDKSQRVGNYFSKVCSVVGGARFYFIHKPCFLLFCVSSSQQTVVTQPTNHLSMVCVCPPPQFSTQQQQQ